MAESCLLSKGVASFFRHVTSARLLLACQGAGFLFIQDLSCPYSGAN